MNAANLSRCLFMVLAGFACVFGQRPPVKEKGALTKSGEYQKGDKDDGRMKEAGGRPRPEAARFRVVLTGFTVNRQTHDHLFETDGKGDEIYALVELAQYDGYAAGLDVYNPFYVASPINHRATGELLLRRSPVSLVAGDTSGDFPGRLTGGSANGARGGLRTGDRYPTNEPWSYGGEAHADRLPMLVWEGELRRGRDLLVIVPTLWEWDGGNPELRARFTQKAQDFFTFNAREGTGFPFVQFVGGDIFTAGDRPVGLIGEDWAPRLLLMTYEGATNAATRSLSGMGAGVLAVQLVEWRRRSEDYTLYLRVERLP